MFDDTSLALVAATDPTAKLTNDLFLEASVRHRHQAGQRPAEALGRLAARADAQEGRLPADHQEQRGAAFRAGVLEEHPAAEQHVHVSVCDHCRASTPFVRRHADDGGAVAAAAATPLPADARSRTYDLWAFVSENWEELLDGLLNTLKVSAIAIVGAFVIGVVLGAARAHRIPVVSQFTAVYVEIIRNTPILVQIFLIFYALPQFGITLESVHRRVALGDDLGRRVQQRELPRRLPGGPVPVPRGRLTHSASASLDLLQRDAADRRPDRAAVVDQHLHLRGQEHVADVRDRLPRADDDARSTSAT